MPVICQVLKQTPFSFNTHRTHKGKILLSLWCREGGWNSETVTCSRLQRKVLMAEFEPRYVRLCNLSSSLYRIPVFRLLNHLLVLGEEIQIVLNLEFENYLILSWKSSGMYTCPWTSQSINSNFQNWRLPCKSLIFPVFVVFYFYPNNSLPCSVRDTWSILFFMFHRWETLSPLYPDKHKVFNGFTSWCHVEVEVMRKGGFFNLQGISFEVGSWKIQLIKIPC